MRLFTTPFSNVILGFDKSFSWSEAHFVFFWSIHLTVVGFNFELASENTNLHLLFFCYPPPYCIYRTPKNWIQSFVAFTRFILSCSFLLGPWALRSSYVWKSYLLFTLPALLRVRAETNVLFVPKLQVTTNWQLQARTSWQGCGSTLGVADLLLSGTSLPWHRSRWTNTASEGFTPMGALPVTTAQGLRFYPSIALW